MSTSKIKEHIMIIESAEGMVEAPAHGNREFRFKKTTTHYAWVHAPDLETAQQMVQDKDEFNDDDVADSRVDTDWEIDS